MFKPFMIPIDSEQEAQALNALIDAGVRHLGSQGVVSAYTMLVKIQGAFDAAQSKVPAPAEPVANGASAH